jgi:large subunit ribosomal protein L24
MATAQKASKPVKMFVRKGDTVKVLRGKDKGVQAKVLKVSPKTNSVVIEGVNVVKKAIKPTQDNPRGGFETFEAPIHASKVMVIGGDGKPTRVGRKIVNGKSVRYGKKDGNVLEDAVN